MRIMKGLTAALFAGGLALGSSQANALSYDRHVDLHNKTATPIDHVQWTNIAVPTYDGIDVLGDSVIYPDETYTLNIDDDSGACSFDILVIYHNGAKQQLRVNVCTARHIDALPTGLAVAF